MGRKRDKLIYEGVNLARKKMSNIRDTWGTPLQIFFTLFRQYHFTVDSCALERNTKLSRFWSPSQNGLIQPWTGERIWCNPPYTEIFVWIERAFEHQTSALSALLLPVRTDQDWWCRYAVRANEMHWFNGRIEFDPPPGIEPSTSLEKHVLLLFYPDRLTPGWCPIQRVRNETTGELIGEEPKPIGAEYGF